MQKSKVAIIRDHIVKNSKFVFPVLVVIVVAVTVSLGLNANNARAEQGDQESQEETAEIMPMSLDEDGQEVEIGDVPLAVNDDGEIYTLVATYYNALATGDIATLTAVCDEISENDLLYYKYMAEYMDHYPLLEVYTKPGAAEGDTVIYVYYKLCFVNHEEEVPGFQAFYACRGENGLYLKAGKNRTESETKYVETVSAQDDVVELHNRTDAEFYELLDQQPELIVYLHELDTEVGAAVGVALAERNAAEEAASQALSQDVIPAAEGGESGAGEPSVEEGPKYAIATTTVNVRDSDSEKAERIGQVSGGSTVQVQEVRVNGWTKVVYDGKDGYIKSDYLQMEESAAGLEIIGTVTATTTVNIRAAANENATRLGILSTGESLDLVADEDGWCKVVYNGKVGYVKADYVQ